MRRLLAVLALLALLVFVVVVVRSNPAHWVLPQRNDEWKQRYDAKLAEAKQRAGQVDLLFIGDSVTEDYDRYDPKLGLDFRPIWLEFFASHRALNLGYNGDRTYNVLWELRHGELDGLAPKDVVLQIGTTDLIPRHLRSNGEAPDEIVQGVMDIVAELHQRLPAARILVVSLLPGDFSSERTARVNAVNAQLQSRVATLPYARWLDVTGIFMDGSRFRREFYYDTTVDPHATSLHPSPAAQRLLAQAVSQALYGH